MPGSREKIAADGLCINDPESCRGRWKDVFGNDNDIFLEIGCGKGRFILENAAKDPGKNYIGIEMYSSVLVRCIEKTREYMEDGFCADNVRFIRMDAAELEKVFEKGEIKKIFLNFSDPWPKDRHAKRRLTSTRFLARYEKILSDGACVEFKTDNSELFAFSIEQLRERGWNLLYCTYDLYGDAEMMKDNIQTEYEIRFTENGQKIMKLIMSPVRNRHMTEEFIERLRSVTSPAAVSTNEPLCEHTSFRIGGPADVFAQPSDEGELINTVKLCLEEKVPYYVLGNGTNVLASDSGFRGVIIQICRRFDRIECEGGTIEAYAGATLAAIANTARNNSLTGMEFASGIPGSLGGAVLMNAGAYGGEMKDIIASVTVYSPSEDRIKTLTGDEMDFGYRKSRIKGTDEIVISAVIELKKGDPEAIKEKMEELKVQRTTKQPLEYPSAGSTFKRPEGYFAGKLIMDAGLKGFSVGGAQVSEKHCGFVINTGGATAKDVKSLMEQVSDKVEAEFGVRLEPEVIFLGEV